jgi:hypothetical protein
MLQDEMTAIENERYEIFRSSTIPENKIKRIKNNAFGNISLTEITTLILKTAGKVYVGELIEEAK